ncbi:MAG: 30S ribosome-binding factor RbfA [Verrucomicrobiota bacterium]|nr:30S ribosome-binding factor RbfA [Verrucomicrobiota bacterium]
MSPRVVRVNELVKREISQILHTKFQSETVYITIREVETEPDLRSARIHYNVLGDDKQKIAAMHFFTKMHTEIRRMLSHRVTFKFLPHLHFIIDQSTERGVRINQLLDDLGFRGEIDPKSLIPPEAEATTQTGTETSPDDGVDDDEDADTDEYLDDDGGEDTEDEGDEEARTDSKA